MVPVMEWSLVPLPAMGQWWVAVMGSVSGYVVDSSGSVVGSSGSVVGQ